MLFIRSFSSELNQTEALAEWLKEVSDALEVISYNRLRFVIHEAFVNACKHSKVQNGSIIVMVRKTDEIEIVVTDSGLGFKLPESLNLVDVQAIGYTWKLAVDRKTEVKATIEAPNTIGFSLDECEDVQGIEDLNESQRGLISILKTANNLRYHFVPNSFNYLQITC